MRPHLPKLVFVSALLCSCGPAAPSTGPGRDGPAAPVDVNWTALVRDYPSARAYAGVRVRVRLDPGDYRVEAGEVRVYAADNGAPAVLVFRPAEAPAVNPRTPLLCRGMCRGPTRDGVWRSRGADFCVVVDDAVVTALPVAPAP